MKGGAALFQRRRGLAGAGLLPVSEGVDHVLLAWLGMPPSPLAWAAYPSGHSKVWSLVQLGRQLRPEASSPSMRRGGGALTDQ